MNNRQNKDCTDNKFSVLTSFIWNWISVIVELKSELPILKIFEFPQPQICIIALLCFYRITSVYSLQLSGKYSIRPVSHWQQLVVRIIRRTISWVKIENDAAKICVVRSTVRPQPSVKGAIQINAIIWSDFYCRSKLVAIV